MLNENLKEKIYINGRLYALITIAVCLLVLVIIAEPRKPKRTVEEIMKSLQETVDAINEENERELQKSIEYSEKLKRKLEEDYGPGKCQICGWPKSYSAKACTHCGDTNE